MVLNFWFLEAKITEGSCAVEIVFWSLRRRDVVVVVGVDDSAEND